MNWDLWLGFATAAATILGVMWRVARHRAKIGQLLSRWRAGRISALRALSVQATLEIEPDGRATLTRQWTGVSSDRTIPAPCVPEILRLPDGSGSFDGQSELQYISEFPKATDLRIIAEHYGMRSLELAVIGGIVRGDPPLSYKHTTRIRIDHSKSTSNSAFKHPCLSVEPVFPVDKLILEVHLPAELAAYPIAFFSGSEHPDSAHISVLQRTFRRNGRTAQLEISQPRVGQRYGIYWIDAENQDQTTKSLAGQAQDDREVLSLHD